RDKYLAGVTVAALDPDVRDAIAKKGIRNALLTSIAPTGTISLFADNVSSGLEPVFSFRYTRNVLMPDGSRREEEVTDYAYRVFRRLRGETAPLSRPEASPGQTYKIRWPDSEHALYITLNDIIQDGRRRPFEIFIHSKNMEHFAWTVALTRMISAVFRRGGDVSFVVEEMKAVFDPRGGAWMEGKYVPSLLAAIGDVIEQHMIEIGFVPPKRRPEAALEGEV